MNGFCKERSFERLPGYIDIELLSNDDCQSLIDEQILFAAPICLCKPAGEVGIAMYNSLVEQ
jgi:hypothetical protein